MIDLAELPDELSDGDGVADSARDEALATYGAEVARMRDEDVKARKDSGIEDIWMRFEEAYLGIDDANRQQFAKAKWAKPIAINGPLTSEQRDKTENKSTAYVRLTTRYVDMGANKLSEIVLPIDDKAFSFKSTPVPDLVAAAKDKTPIRDEMGRMAWRDAAPEEMASVIQGNPAGAFLGAQQGMQPQVPVTRADIAKRQIKEADDAAKKAETRIYDWMVEARYPMQMRKVIKDSARIGVGVLKGPFPDQRKRKAYKDRRLVIERKIQPSYKWIDPWNFFPHSTCGEDIHSGDRCFERDFMSKARLEGLKQLRGVKTEQHPQGEPIYIASQIDKVLAEGPDKCNLDEKGNPTNSNYSEQKEKRFTIWYMTAVVKRGKMRLLGAPGCDVGDGEVPPDDDEDCPAIVTLVNDSVIGATFNPLTKSGSLGYRTFPWSDRPGHWAGVGIGEQVSEPQRMVNAGTRSWLNNAGVASGVQIIRNSRAVTAADGSPDIVPNKIWDLVDESVIDDVRKVFATFEIPDRGDSLFKIIEYAFRLAEELSNIPLVSQGQAGPNDPQTFGQAELQNSNANTLLRQQAYRLDDHVTEPVVDDSYEYLLLDEEIPDDEKGDFDISANGSSAMVEKAIQEQSLMMMGGLVINPAFGVSPARWMEQVLKSKRMDPSTLEYTEEEQEQMRNQPQPKAPAVEAAEIRANTERERMQSNERIAQQREQGQFDRDTAYNQSIARRDASNHQAAMEKLALQERIALAEFATQQKISLEEAQVRLTEKAMELRTQIRLTVSGEGSAPQVATPAFEPPGRAPDGQAYQK